MKNNGILLTLMALCSASIIGLIVNQVLDGEEIGFWALSTQASIFFTGALIIASRKKKFTQ